MYEEYTTGTPVAQDADGTHINGATGQLPPPGFAAWGPIWAAKGYPILPFCAPDGKGGVLYRSVSEEKEIGKAPVYGASSERATTDSQAVALCCRDYPRANIATNLAKAGLVDVSSDSPEYAAEFAQEGFPPGTLSWTSSEDCNIHNVMRLPPGAPQVKENVSQQYDLMSIGCSLLPGGTHRSGKVYTLIGIDRIEDIPRVEDLPLAPGWVLDKLWEIKRRQEAKQSAAAGESDGEPPVKLNTHDRKIWDGDDPAYKIDGTIDHSGTLYKLAMMLAKNGVAAWLIAEMIDERDGALGFDKYTNRSDAQERYRQIASDAVKAYADKLNASHDDAAEIPPVVPGEKLPQAPHDVVKSAASDQELGDARLLAWLYGSRVLHVPERKGPGRWFFWKGPHWVEVYQGRVTSLIMGALPAQYLRHAAALGQDAVREDSNAKDAEKARAGADQIAAIKAKAATLHELSRQALDRAKQLQHLRRAEHVRTLAADLLTPDLETFVWDRDPDLFAVRNGVLDLRTGLLRPGRPSDFIRTFSPVVWRGLHEPCPRFDRFEREIFPSADELEEGVVTTGDVGKINFVNEVLAIGLSGHVSEHILVIMYGGGFNGKDTLIKIDAAVAGGYAETVDKRVVMAHRESGGATPEMMVLKGKRLVWTSETSEGAALDIAQVKLLTGGGAQTGRGLYQDQETWLPTYTPILMTNHLPRIDASDDAIWGRVKVIIFPRSFKNANERSDEDTQDKSQFPIDPELENALQSELSGILALLVRSGMRWRERGGLRPPDSVKLATQEYRKAENDVEQFVEEECVLGEGHEVRTGVLYAAYSEWAKRQGVAHPISNVLFSKRLGKIAGVVTGARDRDSNRIYRGIGERPVQWKNAAPS